MLGKVSIIVPIYNGGELLHECLSSILAQSYKNLEIILVNDGSTDDSLDVCRKFSQRDRRIVIFTQTNSGVSSARNLGITKASGEYITFMDADDFLFPDAISQMVHELNEAGTDAIRTRCEVDQGGVVRLEDLPESRTYHGSDLALAIEAVTTGSIAAYSWLLMIKIEKLALDVRFDPQINILEDLCFYVDLLMSIDSFALSDAVTYRYFVHSESASHDLGRAVINAESIFLVNSRFNRILKGRGFLRNINAVHAKILSSTAVSLCTSRQGRGLVFEFFELLERKRFRAIVDASKLEFLPLSSRALVFSVSKGPLFTFAASWCFVFFKSISPLELKKALHRRS